MFKVVLVGMADGAERAQVVKKLAGLFNVPPEKADRILDTPGFVLMIGAIQAEIERFQAALAAAGVVSQVDGYRISDNIVPVKDHAAEPAPVDPQKGKLRYIASDEPVPEQPHNPYQHSDTEHQDVRLGAEKGLYRVILMGVAEGVAREEVLQNLAALFNTSPKRAAKVLDTPDFVVKISADEAEVRRYLAAMEGAGTRCRIENYEISQKPETEKDLGPDPSHTDPVHKKIEYLTQETPDPESAPLPYKVHPVMARKKVSSGMLRFLSQLAMVGVAVAVVVVLVLVGLERREAGQREAQELAKEASSARVTVGLDGKPLEVVPLPTARTKLTLTPIVYQCVRADGAQSVTAYLANGQFVETTTTALRQPGDTSFGMWTLVGSQVVQTVLGQRLANPPALEPSPWRNLDPYWRTLDYQMSGGAGRAVVISQVSNGINVGSLDEPASCQIGNGAALEAAAKFLAGMPRQLLPQAIISSPASPEASQLKAGTVEGSKENPVNVGFPREGASKQIWVGTVDKGSPTYFRFLGTGYGRLVEVKVHSPGNEAQVTVLTQQRAYPPSQGRDVVANGLNYLVSVSTDSPSTTYRLSIREFEDNNAQANAETVINRLNERYEELGKRCPSLANQSFGTRFAGAMSHFNAGESNVKVMGRYHITTLTQFEMAREFAEEGLDRVDADMEKAERICKNGPK